MEKTTTAVSKAATTTTTTAATTAVSTTTTAASTATTKTTTAAANTTATTTAATKTTTAIATTAREVEDATSQKEATPEVVSQQIDIVVAVRVASAIGGVIAIAGVTVFCILRCRRTIPEENAPNEEGHEMVNLAPATPAPIVEPIAEVHIVEPIHPNSVVLVIEEQNAPNEGGHEMVNLAPATPAPIVEPIVEPIHPNSVVLVIEEQNSLQVEPDNRAIDVEQVNMADIREATGIVATKVAYYNSLEH